MRVLILGGNGMLGHKLVQALGEDFETFAAIRREFSSVERFDIFDRDRTIAELDVTSPERLRQAIAQVRPDVVVNCVGIIKQIASTQETMVQINTLLPRSLADLSKEMGFRLISMSTDCVFSGLKGNCTETHECDAEDEYGQTKFRGEVAQDNCLTIRSSIIGRELDTSHSLIEWFLTKRNQTIGGYTRAIYSGFPTIVFAEIISSLIKDNCEMSGIFHISSDPISKYDLLTLANEAYGANITIEPDDSFAIDRSLDSTNFRIATGFKPPTWPEMIERMAADITPYDRFHMAE